MAVHTSTPPNRFQAPLRQMATNFEQFQTRIANHIKLTIETVLRKEGNGRKSLRYRNDKTMRIFAPISGSAYSPEQQRGMKADQHRRGVSLERRQIFYVAPTVLLSECEAAFVQQQKNCLSPMDNHILHDIFS
jgi:hypothetical protein